MGRESKIKEARRNDGKDFEDFIETVERLLAPTGAKVKRNAKVPDVDTDEPRDVDIWITHQVDGREKRVMVECRDHSRSQHVMWIEQLMGKRVSVNADVVIAVTRKPLTRPAEIKAEKRDIQVRCVRDLKDDGIIEMMKTAIPGLNVGINNVRATFDHYMFQWRSLSLVFADRDPEPNMPRDPEVLGRLSKDVMRAPFLFDAERQNGFTIDDFVKELIAEGCDLTAGAPLGIEVERSERRGIVGDWFAPQSNGGWRRVVEIEVGFRAKRLIDEVKLDRYAYESKGLIAQIASKTWRAPDKRNEFKLTVAFHERGLNTSVVSIPCEARDGVASPSLETQE